MYKVVFEYKSGKKGYCADGGVMLFETEKEAAAFAQELNDCIEDDYRDFFPIWSAIKADEEGGTSEST